LESSSVAIIQNQINSLNKKLDDLLELLLDKKITQEQYDSKNKKFSNDLIILKSQLKNLNPESRSYFGTCRKDQK